MRFKKPLPSDCLQSHWLQLTWKATPRAAATRAACQDHSFGQRPEFVMNLHSRGALRENPRQSLHWCDPCEVFLASWSVPTSMRLESGRRGWATMKISRLPPIEPSGDRRSWLAMPSRAFRRDAMTPVALFTGLYPPEAAQHGVPRRTQAADVLVKGQPLPEDVMYVGYGHFSHRWPCTKWRCPFEVGRHGSPAEVLVQYIRHMQAAPLKQQLHELRGKRLACDCPVGTHCHADALASFFPPL